MLYSSCRRVSLKNTVVPGEVIMKLKCMLTPETLWIPATVLLYLILLLCTVKTAQNTAVHGSDVSAGLHEIAVLSSQFCDIRETDFIDRVIWRKYEGQTSHKILVHEVHNATEYFPSFQGHIKYHFDNQSLIFYDVQKKDEGVYRASLEYKNSTIVDQNITLWVKTPPEIHIDGNDSHRTLTCKYDTPPGEILRKWLQNGQPLSLNDRYTLSEGNQTLLLSNMTVEDCRTYSCLVTDGRSEKEAHIHLTGENTPLCGESTTFTAVLKAIGIALIAFIAIISLIAFAIRCLRKYYLGHRKNDQMTEGNKTATGQSQKTQRTSVRECAYMVPDNTSDHHVYETIGEPKEETHSSCVYMLQGSQQPSLSSPSQEQQNEGIYSYIGNPQPMTLNPPDIPGAVDLDISVMDQ
ncbi:uncharacterized protein LOC125744427 isoform X2 [Brienomyrus brachyistius]|uniref:uncharacterized protein LOC125744427 isoform X2 n=1 Tax=Brienomyrus brachyistius TaxID=42636 RepID=UPI0020B1BB99|nr:uncharacterized protein LOC125744427 isoform X2 [Brienomyrus brachyistius]